VAPNSHLRLSLPRVIMGMLNISGTSKAGVITAMKAISDAHEAKSSTAHRRPSKRGAVSRS